nr:hypothetical protein [Tsukamurella paurometabola]
MRYIATPSWAAARAADRIAVRSFGSSLVTAGTSASTATRSSTTPSASPSCPTVLVSTPPGIPGSVSEHAAITAATATRTTSAAADFVST